MRIPLLISLVTAALLAGSASAQNYGYGDQSTESHSSGTSPDWHNQQSQSQPYTSPYGSQYGNQQYNSQWSNRGQSSNQSWKNQSVSSSQFFDTKKLLGQEVMNTQGQEVGTIRDIGFSPQYGEIFAAIGIGNGQSVLVPAQALMFSGSRNNLQVTLNASKQQLQSGPTVQNSQWIQALNNPSFTQRAFSYFNVEPSTSGMGGSSSSSLGGSSSSGGVQH